jgi:hypothetical protein
MWATGGTFARMGRKSRLKEERKTDWREFESFIERIERVLAPTGASVRRNARIKDIDTGELRDIDVWIVKETSNGTKRTMVECRDRSKRQDVMWIEQLMGKRISVGADEVLAVTKKPISDPARVKAEKRGIQTRCVRELGDDEILGIFQTGIPGVTITLNRLDAEAVVDHVLPTELTLIFADGDPEKEADADPAVTEPLRHDLMRAKFIFDESGKHGLSIENILLWARRNGYDPARGGVLGQDIDSKVRLKAGQTLYAPTTGGGRRPVAEIEVSFKARRSHERIDLARHAYEGTPTPTRIVSGAWTSPDRKDRYTITLSVDDRGLRGEVERSRTPPSKP